MSDATSSARRGLEAGMVAVGRLVGPALVAVAGAQLCEDAVSWGWFAVGLVGAAFTVTRAAALSEPTAPEPETMYGPIEFLHRHSHTHTMSGTIDAVAAVEMPARPESSSSPALSSEPSTMTLVTSSSDALYAKMNDLVSALSHMGYKKGAATDVAREVLTATPEAPLEELLRRALKGKKSEGGA